MQVGFSEGLMIIQAVLYIGGLLFGFAITWGKIKRITEDHERRIKSQEDKLTQQNGTPSYITPKVCEDNRKERDKEINHIKEYITDQRQKMDDLIKDVSAIKSKLKVNRRAENNH